MTDREGTVLIPEIPVVKTEVSYRELLREGAKLLSEAEIPDADLDAWLLLSEVSGMSRAKYFMDQWEKVPQDQQERYRSWIRLRTERIPLQHILGEAWFMGLPFEVNGDVLVPRQDTEKLVELVLAGGRDAGRLLDVCTGSGCIAVSLAVMGHFREVTATDISEKALTVARRNARKNGAEVSFAEGDMFASVPGEKYDVITSNPPYIPSADCEELMPEVRDHDPRLALDGHEDGLYFYRILAEQSREHLNPGGRVFFEIGWDQGEAVSEMLERAGFREVRVVRDDAGQNRVVTGVWS